MILNKDLAVKAREKMESIIERGRVKAHSGMVDIEHEYKTRNDYVITPERLGYFNKPYKGVDVIQIKGRKETKEFKMTDYAQSQLLGKIGMPKTFYTTLMSKEEDWAGELLYQNLTTLTKKNITGERVLLREVDGTVKGFLSDAYRRMDAGPVFETFVQTGLKHKLVPSDGMNTETKYHLKMLSPEIYEPIEGEIVGFGLSLTTSDYGAGALQMQLFAMRVWCANLAIGDNMFRQVHLGHRFGGDQLAFSERTYQLDTKTVSSAVDDIVKYQFPREINKTLEHIKVSAEKDIDVDKAVKSLRDRGTLTKSQSEGAKELYKNVTNDLLPKQEGAWRFSNVLSLMSQNKELSGDDSLRLQEAAYAVIN